MHTMAQRKLGHDHGDFCSSVVTSASGWGYSLELARKGLNVVIMSRSEEKLQKVADEISKSILIAVCGFQINNCSHRLWGKVSLLPLIYGSI